MNRFTRVDGGTFGLSRSGKVGECGPGFIWPRIVTWVFLKDLKTEEYFYVFNTHFPVESAGGRKFSAKVLTLAIPKFAGDFPFILMGDFNAAYDSEPLKIIRDRLNVSFSSSLSVIPLKCIDFIFHTLGKIKSSFTEYGPKKWNRHYASDHYPVVTSISMVI